MPLVSNFDEEDPECEILGVDIKGNDPKYSDISDDDSDIPSSQMQNKQEIKIRGE